MNSPALQVTQLDDYLQALGMNRASPKVTEWTLQGQIPAKYLACLPPEQSQDTSFRTKQSKSNSNLAIT
jgi:hypothetical protein